MWRSEVVSCEASRITASCGIVGGHSPKSNDAPLLRIVVFLAINRSLCHNSCQRFRLILGFNQQKLITKEIPMVVRKYPRYPVSYSSTLVQKDAFRHKGSLRDLSIRGCRVESIIQPFTGMQVELHLHIPGDPTRIPIRKTRVLWSGPRGGGMIFWPPPPPKKAGPTGLLQKLKKKFYF